MAKGFLSALGYRDFRRLWICNFISNIGTWVHTVALSLWVHEKYATPGWLGFVQFCSYIPALLLFLIAGSLADLMNRKKLLIVTQIIMALGALILALEVTLDIANLLTVSFTVFAIGVGIALNFPAWQAIIPDIIPPKDILNAVSLNSASWNMARFLGPMLGAAIASWSLSFCFYLNSLSFLPFAFIIALIVLPPRHRKDWRNSFNRSHLTEGIRYSLARSWARNLLLTFGLLNFFAIPYLAFLPIFGKDILHAGDFGVGALYAATGLGAVAGVPLLNLLNRRWEERTIIKAGALILPGSLILFSFSRHLWLSNFALFMTGTSYLCTASSINTLLQLKVDEEIRGRVMSLYVLMITGIYPLGSILLGFIANRFGIPKVLAISSAVVLAYGINLALSEQLREASIKGASQ